MPQLRQKLLEGVLWEEEAQESEKELLGLQAWVVVSEKELLGLQLWVAVSALRSSL